MGTRGRCVIEVTGAQPYRVDIRPGALDELPTLLAGAERVLVVHPAVLADRAHALAASLDAQVTRFEVPDGEAAKTTEVLAAGWQLLAEVGFTRSDVVVGLGGGSTTDLAGFLAASWLRGVGFVSVPTTVLAMVDAAVGGKTGINLSAGKNLVGAFHEPLGVLCDLSLLTTLPDQEVVSGLAEVVKCGFIDDPRIVELVEQDPVEARDVGSERFAELVIRAVQVKATVVSVDLREATSGAWRVGRERLNYGHTLGHAIEKTEHFSWRHGEAISVGMAFAAELSRRTLGLDAGLVVRQVELLDALGLPTSHPTGQWEALRKAMALDKKARGNRLRFVGLCDFGEVAIIEAPGEDELQASWRTVS